MGISGPNDFFSLTVYIRPIFTEWQRKVGFAPIDSNAVVGPAFLIAIYSEDGNAMHKSIENVRPAYSVYNFFFIYCERTYFSAAKFSHIKPSATFSRGHIFAHLVTNSI